jgi:hypothetical protein
MAMMNDEKLSPTQQKVMEEWPCNSELVYLPKQRWWKEVVSFREGSEEVGPYLQGSTVKALHRKGAIKKVNDDPWFYVYRRA